MTGLNLNRVNLIGRVVDHIFYTTTERAAADLIRFKVATPNENHEPDTHQCLAWGPIGLQLHTYLKRGSQIALRGKLSYHQFENSLGEQVITPEIRVDQFTFLGD
ncbi:hypothetical protein CEQ90_08100 [Lewinellaceae bacterium SD302]|nr:hypothetical protein CEQ90_08100 [Lewinellaceae bacterium SD302]